MATIDEIIRKLRINSRNFNVMAMMDESMEENILVGKLYIRLLNLLPRVAKRVRYSLSRLNEYRLFGSVSLPTCQVVGCSVSVEVHASLD